LINNGDQNYPAAALTALTAASSRSLATTILIEELLELN